MAQQLRAVDALVDNQGVVSSTYMVSIHHLQLQFQGILLWNNYFVQCEYLLLSLV